MNSYYLVVEANMQWQTYIISCKDDKVEEYFSLFNTPNGSQLFNNIYGRELHWKYKELSGRLNEHVYGWTISKSEYDRIRQLIEIKPIYDEYLKLINNE